MTGNPMITAAKMICKSLDALTRELWLLRTGAGDEGSAQMEDEKLEGSPQVANENNFLKSTGEGNHFQL